MSCIGLAHNAPPAIFILLNCMSCHWHSEQLLSLFLCPAENYYCPSITSATGSSLSASPPISPSYPQGTQANIPKFTFLPSIPNLSFHPFGNIFPSGMPKSLPAPNTISPTDYLKIMRYFCHHFHIKVYTVFVTKLSWQLEVCQVFTLYIICKTAHY